MRASDTSIDSLNAVRDRSLEDAYETHDVAQAYCIERLSWYGYSVEEYGIDQRGADTPMTDDKPDLRVLDPQSGDATADTVGYIEVKSKTSGEWMGRLNDRHFHKYLYGDANEDDPFEGAKALAEPVYIYFCLVNDDAGTIRDEQLIPVLTESQIVDELWAHGNKVVELSDHDVQTWTEMVYRFRQ